jgi:hypothetical protein
VVEVGDVVVWRLWLCSCGGLEVVVWSGKRWSVPKFPSFLVSPMIMIARAPRPGQAR